ncbi:hypothetical protein D1872_266370 [compost metagenome]
MGIRIVDAVRHTVLRVTLQKFGVRLGTRRIALDPSGRDAQRASHHDHGSGEIIAIALLDVEQKSVDKILALLAR